MQLAENSSNSMKFLLTLSYMTSEDIVRAIAMGTIIYAGQRDMATRCAP